MKIILFSLALLVIILITNNLSKSPKLLQCDIGTQELFKFSLKNNNAPLIKSDSLQLHINSLISSDSKFKNIRFINTQNVNNSHNRDTLIFNHGQCIKLLTNSNQDVIAIAFLSQNYRMEWSDVEILIKIIEPFNSKERWYSSDIYKIAVNLYEGYSFNSDDHHFYYQYHHDGTNGLFLVNKNNEKLTFFLFKNTE